MIEMRWYVPVSGEKVLQYRYEHDVGGPYPNYQWSEWKDVPEYVERDRPEEQPEQDPDDWKDRLIAQHEETILWQAKRIVELTVQQEQEPVELDLSGMQKLLKQSGYDNATPQERTAFISGVKHREAEMLDTQPQRTWEGLSMFEINDLMENTEYEDYRDLVERTEAKLKEKNT